MKSLFHVAIVLIVCLVGLCVYWHFYPHHAPGFVRDNIPGFEFTSPRSPMSNFRPPQFGPR